ncbi:MAG: ATP-dependent helicase HrpB [Aquihabitans sp.]
MTRLPIVDPTGLPVEEVVGEVAAALDATGTAVLVAPPGAGKTTVVPLRLLDAPWLDGQRIVVLEPRRLAARAAALRMADLLGEPLGRTVGYRTRDERVGGAGVRIEVVTEGILVRRLQTDPTLEGTGLVVLDEVHERNLVTDLSLALVTDARRGLRPDLRVLAMSATVDADRFARVLGDDEPAPVLRSEGRTFPVDVVHRPPAARDGDDAHLARVVGSAVADHADGDVLVFLPGAAAINRVADRLRTPGALPPTVDVRPLFGALSTAEQDLALAPSPAGRRRVVLATDIAESSLTVAGVRIVVDAGLVRVPRFDPASGMTRLQTEPSSLASADQRAGRAGRLGPGVAYRAWDPSDATRRPRFPVAEIAVADLAGFALELAVWGASIDQLALVERPPAGALEQAIALLRALGAIDDRGRPTARGRAMAALPVHPRLAAMVLAGHDAGAGWAASVVAALLEERDVVRGRPHERPADLVARARAVVGDPTDLAVDRNGVRTVRRRAEQLAQRAGTGRGDLAADEVGPLVAVAYPERIAQASGRGYRLRGGGGGQLDGTDPLAGSPFLAVATVEDGPRGPRIALAAELTEAEVRAAVGDDVTEVATLQWDAGRDDLRARTEVRAGALVLDATDGPPAPGPDTTAALVARVRETNGAILRWTPAARTLQGRLAFLHGLRPDAWPDVADTALLATLDDWLAPLLPGATSRRDLERIDLVQAVRAGLDHGARQAVDRLAPTSFPAADGRAVAIAYDDGTPRASARVQDLYGLTTHPTVADGAVPVVVELLSPASRPVQVTADLPGFWQGSWAEVRKEMAGRYPKHDWPADPASAQPGRRSRRGR